MLNVNRLAVLMEIPGLVFLLQFQRQASGSGHCFQCKCLALHSLDREELEYANVFLLLNRCFWCSTRFVYQCEFAAQMTGDQICVILDQPAVFCQCRRATIEYLFQWLLAPIALHKKITFSYY